MLTRGLPNSTNDVYQIIKKHSDVPKITPNMDLKRDLGLDSLTIYMIIYEIENHYSIQMPDNDNHITVQDIILATSTAINERNKRLKGFMGTRDNLSR